MDITDPDYVPHGSTFSLDWSPWFLVDGKRVAILAYLSKNYVGFRRITIVGDWERGQTPHVDVEQTDMTSICMFLSTDAYIRWEDQVRISSSSYVFFTNECEIATTMARGVIATPFDVKPFQVAVDETAKEATEPHYTWECATTYSKEDEQTSLNPISGEYSLELVD